MKGFSSNWASVTNVASPLKNDKSGSFQNYNSACQGTGKINFCGYLGQSKDGVSEHVKTIKKLANYSILISE